MVVYQLTTQTTRIQHESEHAVTNSNVNDARSEFLCYNTGGQHNTAVGDPYRSNSHQLQFDYNGQGETKSYYNMQNNHNHNYDVSNNYNDMHDNMTIKSYSHINGNYNDRIAKHAHFPKSSDMSESMQQISKYSQSSHAKTMEYNFDKNNANSATNAENIEDDEVKLTKLLKNMQKTNPEYLKQVLANIGSQLASGGSGHSQEFKEAKENNVDDTNNDYEEESKWDMLPSSHKAEQEKAKSGLTNDATIAKELKEMTSSVSGAGFGANKKHVSHQKSKTKQKHGLGNVMGSLVGASGMAQGFGHVHGNQTNINHNQSQELKSNNCESKMDNDCNVHVITSDSDGIVGVNGTNSNGDYGYGHGYQGLKWYCMVEFMPHIFTSGNAMELYWKPYPQDIQKILFDKWNRFVNDPKSPANKSVNIELDGRHYTIFFIEGQEKEKNPYARQMSDRALIRDVRLDKPDKNGNIWDFRVLPN